MCRENRKSLFVVIVWSCDNKRLTFFECGCAEQESRAVEAKIDVILCFIHLILPRFTRDVSSSFQPSLS